MTQRMIVRFLRAWSVLVLLLCAHAAANSSMPFGSLYVTSLPSAADVWIDGSYIGRTPLLIDGLRAGKHTVTVTKTGWKAQDVDQSVTAGVMSTASVQLQMQSALGGSGLIVLHGLLPTARVSIDDGAPKRLLPAYRVSAGTHHLIVRQSDGRYERTATVYADQTTHLLFAAAAAPRHSAVVAPVNDYFPPSASKIVGNRIVIRWKGHVVTGRLGDARFSVDKRDVIYDAPAGLVRGRLYLPLDLILAIDGKDNK